MNFSPQSQNRKPIRRSAPSRRHALLVLGVLSFATVPAASTALGAPRDVEVMRIPGGGLQPQAEVDGEGTLHLLYFRGEPAGGDLYYTRRTRTAPAFAAPMRVNHTPGTALAVGTIRGGQLAVGRNGRIHVAWNGPAPKGGDHLRAPMLYTRLNDTGTSFEAERDLITTARGLDGGGSLAADSRGNVHVAWHAPMPNGKQGEPGRAVFVATSHDDGITFAAERAVGGQPGGACGCCGMKTIADASGRLYLSYRGASESGHRDQRLLVSHDGGLAAEVVLEHPWKVATCPMSSTSLTRAGDAVLAAWETAGQVYWTCFKTPDQAPSTPRSPRDVGPHPKHPVAAGHAGGEVMLVWTEGTGWARGGTVAWQRFDASGEPVGARGHAPGLPVWSMATAARWDDRYVVIY